MSLFANVSSSTGSSAPLKPGCPVAVTLVKAEISKVNAETGKGQDGNLVISFKGSDVLNAGTSRFVFWLNNFDNTDPKYNEKTAENTLSQIKQIMEAFATPTEIDATVTAGDIKTAFVQVASLLNSKVGSPANMKIVYKKGSDEEVVLPNFGDFISTELAPRGLVLSTKAGADGIPYDRVKTLESLGIKAPAANALPGQAGTIPGSFPAAGIPAAAPAPMSRPVPTAAPASPTSEPAFGVPTV